MERPLPLAAAKPDPECATFRPLAGPSERFPALDFPADQAAAISPIRFVSDDDPPVLLIHGDADELVPIRNSEALTAELDRVGVVHDSRIIEGGDNTLLGAKYTATYLMMY